jgi:hypothetical protein
MRPPASKGTCVVATAEVQLQTTRDKRPRHRLHHPCSAVSPSSPNAPGASFLTAASSRAKSSAAGGVRLMASRSPNWASASARSPIPSPLRRGGVPVELRTAAMSSLRGAPALAKSPATLTHRQRSLTGDPTLAISHGQTRVPCASFARARGRTPPPSPPPS